MGNFSNIADCCRNFSAILSQNKSKLQSQIVTFAVFCCILNKFLTYVLRRTIAGWKISGFGQFIFSGALKLIPGLSVPAQGNTRETITGHKTKLK